MKFFLGALATLGVVFNALAAEPTVTAQDLPRVAPTEPARALSTFQVRPGFHLELVAAEPLVVDPIALAFDERGRLFVVEMRDYSERRDERLGRIKLLEDTDGDGRFDKATVYVDKLPWPTAVICWDGGIFVGSSPDILYCKDTDGDGVADVRRTIFTGFGNAVARLNVQALLNSFTWGLDNRIHGALGGNPGTITNLIVRAAKPLELRGRDFSFDPRALDLRAESGGGQYGLSFDDAGRKFICSNSRHIQLVLYEDRYAGRNSVHTLPAAAVDIAVDGPAAEVYRLSPDEPWRVIRTKWRVSGQVPGLIEGGGRPSGYFTGATGITIYRGDAWPPDFLGDAFIADCGSNLVHRKKLRPDGVALKAERAADEQRGEFLASTDNWFRPVQFANAPDGTLYVADMYRETIEHPWSLPESLKQHLDLNSGNDRGRIYRIVADGAGRRGDESAADRKISARTFSGATTGELVTLLAHSNGWHRDTAARLLYERQDKAAVPALEKLLSSSKSSLGRLHALYALDGLQALTARHLRAALADAAPEVREHAVRLSERHNASELLAALRRRVSDTSARVRFQLAFAFSELRYPQKARDLAKLVGQGSESVWMQEVVLLAAGSDAAGLFTALGSGRTTAEAEFRQRLARIIGARNDPGSVSVVLAGLDALKDDGQAFALVRALGEGLQRAGRSLAQVDGAGKVQSLFERATKLAADVRTPEATRVQAVQLLGISGGDKAAETLLAQVQPGVPPAVQFAAVSALSTLNPPRLGTALVARWKACTPQLRARLLSVLLARPERIDALLTGVEQETIGRGELSAADLAALRTHRQVAVRERANKLFAAPVAKRDEVVKQFQPALELRGDALRGRAIYLNRCASCHRSGRDGFALGPDLASVKTSGKEKLLVGILDPSREVAAAFLAYSVDTKDGESLTGLIAAETPASLTLRRANGESSFVPRERVASLQSLGQSLMPEGLETGLSQADMADLLEFIANAEAVK